MEAIILITSTAAGSSKAFFPLIPIIAKAVGLGAKKHGLSKAAKEAAKEAAKDKAKEKLQNKKKDKTE